MKTKKVLYFVLLFLLILLCVGSVFKLYKSKKLGGWWEKEKRPVISVKNFLEGSFQQDFDTYLNRNSTYYNGLVRFHNQINYSLFNATLNSSLFCGKEGVLYEKGHIYNALYGQWTEKMPYFIEKSAKFAKIKDTLTKQGKDFIYIAAPGKGSLYPEYLPNHISHLRMNLSPQTTFLRQFDSLGVDYIDFDKYFIELRKTDNTPIFSKYGIHYTKYAAYKVIDSLSRYFEKKYPFMPKVVLDSMTKDYTEWENENDIYKAANLIFKHPKEELTHPYFHYEQRSDKHLKCVVIGDSFVWQLFYLNFFDKYFKDSQFWYYFNEVFYAGDGDKTTTIDKIDVIDELSKADVIMVLFTNGTTLDYDKGFTDTVYKHYFGNK